MRRLSIQLNDEQWRRLREVAYREQISISEVIRRILDGRLAWRKG